MLDAAFAKWLDANAEAIDQGQCDPQLVLAHIAESQLLRIGVDPALGGSGGEVTDAVEAIAAIASRSLATAFVCWGQRAFIEYLLQSPNQALRARGELPDARYETLAAFAREVIATRGNVSDATYQAFREAGFSEGNALEVILGVSLATLCNFANVFAQTPLNDELGKYRWQPSA